MQSPASMKRLFIVDPSLKDLRGHHYMMTREATRSAQALGFEVTWLCSADFSGTLDRENAEIAPVFQATTYDAYIKQKERAAAKPSLFRRFMNRLTSTPRAVAPAAPQPSFYDDLKAAIADKNIGPQDRLLLHTGDGDSLPAVARLVREGSLETLPVIHMATPYDPVGVMPHRQNIEGFAGLLDILKTENKLDQKLFLYAENAYLAEHLSDVWNARVRPLPIPASPPPANAEKEARAALAEKMNLAEGSFIVTSLGSARLEKGFHKIPAIAGEVFARAASGEPGAPVRFILHASPQIVGRDPKITEAIEALSVRPPHEVTLLLAPLSDEDYRMLLEASDVALLPYGEREYRVRGSAVVTEALAAGKTIVASANTYPGKMAEAHGGLTAESPAGFADAILNVYKNRADYRARAKSESETFIVSNSVESYWRRCLDAEREAGLSES